MKTIKWGIIGAGRISSTFATALNSLDHTELVGIASRDLDRATEFANRFHIKNVYGSYEELVKDPEIDVIYIATPHTEHKANAALCITNGKAVLCEKPFTLNQHETPRPPCRRGPPRRYPAPPPATRLQAVWRRWPAQARPLPR